MQIKIETHEDGSYWVTYGTKWTGPFDTVLKASDCVVQIVADRAKEIAGNNVYFLEGKFK